MSRGAVAPAPARQRGERGAAIPLVALLLPVLLIMTAFAVDLGRQRVSRRTMQARADVVALDMLRLADGRDEDAILTDPGYASFLSGTADRNHALEILNRGDLIVEYGTWTEASGFVQTLGNGIPDAVEVTAKDEIDYFFQPGTGKTERSAVAALGGEPRAGFTIGSFGAAISPDQAGLLNAMLTPLLGSPAGLNALSYQGLATANVGLGELAAELGLLTPSDVFTSEVSTEELLVAAADVLRANGDTANANILDGLITSQVQSMGDVTLGQFAHVEQGSEDAALTGEVNVLALVQGAVLLSQCTDPADPGTCSALALPGLGLSLPGLDVAADLRVIQGPVSHYGTVGTGTSTSQLELGFQAEIGAQEVGRCTPTGLGLNCLLSGLGNLLGFIVDSPVTVDASIRLAEGAATIDDIDCVGDQGLDVAVWTGLYEMDLTVTLDFSKRSLLSVLLAPLGQVTLEFSTTPPGTFDLAEFDVPPDVLGVTVESTGTGSVGLSNVGLTVTSGSGVLGTLGGLGVTNTVGPLLTLLVNPLLEAMDDFILGPLTDLLGVNVAGSDITPERIDCVPARPKLVG